MFAKPKPDVPPAGRELDARLALALGWSWHVVGDDLRLLCPPEQDRHDGFFFDVERDAYQLVPPLSTDWAAAGELLAQWADRCTVELLRINPHDGDWICDLQGLVAGGAMLERARGIAPTGPHAIAWAVCQAAEALREVEGAAVPRPVVLLSPERELLTVVHPQPRRGPVYHTEN